MDIYPKINTQKEARKQGLKRYFTGKPCKNGHVSERYIGGGCLECMPTAGKKWRKKNGEKRKKYQKEWHIKNPSYNKNQQKQRRHNNLNSKLAHNIKPLANFDLTNRDQFLEACHYTNLQPMFWHDNLTKCAKNP